jgi:hypothetical protein
MSSNISSLRRSDVTWILEEIMKADSEIAAGNKDRYMSGRAVALKACASHFMSVSRSDLDRYMKWLVPEVESGKRIGALPEPLAWVRGNPA